MSKAFALAIAPTSAVRSPAKDRLSSLGTITEAFLGLRYSQALRFQPAAPHVTRLCARRPTPARIFPA